MLRQLMGALCALLLAMSTAAPGLAATAPMPHAPSGGVRFQDDRTADAGTGQEVTPGEDVVVNDVSDNAVPADEASGEEGASDETTAPDPPLGESDEQPVAEDDFADFSMPGMNSNNLTGAVLGDIDAFWAGELASHGRDYYAAGTVPITQPTESSCGTFGPYDNPAAYCPLDDTVYYSLPLSQDIQTSVGDFAWITVLAHEWGHHVQVVLGITPELTVDRELQADCMAGAYTQHAKLQGFLQEGDVSEGALMAMLSGDPVGLDEMAAGAHGSSDDRVTSFMQGYLNGSAACIAF